MDVIKKKDGSKVIVYSNGMRVKVLKDGSRSRPYYHFRDIAEDLESDEDLDRELLEMYVDDSGKHSSSDT